MEPCNNVQFVFSRFERYGYSELFYTITLVKYVIIDLDKGLPLSLVQDKSMYGFPSQKILHYNGVIMSTMASQITSLMIVYSIVYTGVDQRKHQSSASLAFVRGIHRWPVNSPHKGPVTRKNFPFDDVIMQSSFNALYHMRVGIIVAFMKLRLWCVLGLQRSINPTNTLREC